MVKKLTNLEIIKKSKDGRYYYVKNKDNEIEKRFIYHCCICNKEIIEYRPIRFTKQLFGYGNYKQYEDIRSYDFCDKCYETLKKGLDKWKRKKSEGV